MERCQAFQTLFLTCLLLLYITLITHIPCLVHNVVHYRHAISCCHCKLDSCTRLFFLNCTRVVAIVDCTACSVSYNLLQCHGNSCTGELNQPNCYSFLWTSKEREVHKLNIRTECASLNSVSDKNRQHDPHTNMNVLAFDNTYFSFQVFWLY